MREVLCVLGAMVLCAVIGGGALSLLWIAVGAEKIGGPEA